MSREDERTVSEDWYRSLLAGADQQYAEAAAAYDEVLLPRARTLAAGLDPIAAWAVLQRELHEQLGDRAPFLGELLALAVLREVAFTDHPEQGKGKCP